MNRFLSSHGFLRILALVLAFILWIGVNSPDSGAGTVQSNTYEHFPFSIQVMTGQNTVATAMNYQTATVSVNENTANLSTLPSQMADVRVVADASKLSPGVHAVPLTAMNLPSALATTIQPDSITVTIAKKSSTTALVHLQVLGAPAIGYVQGTPMTNVQYVTVSGSFGAVNKVTSVVGLVSVQNAETTISHTVTLNAIDSFGRMVSGVTITPAAVTATVPVSLPNRTVQVTPQITGQPAQGYEVAGVSVNPSSLKAMSPSGSDVLPSVNIPVNVSGLRKTTTLHIAVPREPGSLKFAPDSVVVTVQIEKSLSKVFTNVPIQIRNAPSGRTVVLTGDSTVDVTVSGPESIISALTLNDVLVYIDAEQLDATDSTAPLVIQLPSWVKLSHMSLEQVPVSVSG